MHPGWIVLLGWGASGPMAAALAASISSSATGAATLSHAAALSASVSASATASAWLQSGTTRFRSAAYTDVQAASDSTITVNCPAGVQAGDLLVAGVRGFSGSYVPSAPSGWSVATSGSSGFLRWAMFYKRADGTESSPLTFAYTGAVTFRGVVVAAYTGCSKGASQSALCDGSAGGSDTVSPYTASTQTDYADELVVAYFVTSAPNCIYTQLGGSEVRVSSGVTDGSQCLADITGGAPAWTDLSVDTAATIQNYIAASFLNTRSDIAASASGTATGDAALTLLTLGQPTGKRHGNPFMRGDHSIFGPRRW